jgi:hypothetical protein
MTKPTHKHLEWFYGDVVEREGGGFELVGEPTPIDMNSLSIEHQSIFQALEEQIEEANKAAEKGGKYQGERTLSHKRIKAITKDRKRQMRERGEKINSNAQPPEDRPILYRRDGNYIAIGGEAARRLQERTFVYIDREWLSVNMIGTDDSGTIIARDLIPVDMQSLSPEDRCALAVVKEELDETKKNAIEMGFEVEGEGASLLQSDVVEAKIDERIRRMKSAH